ncbi:MAG: 2-amino-4-hydroxy-6-hydroxymethyldihydropteridine diphosphokinase [Victivallaceae bacterium]|nr:2-amino-4-hydroxy-6-hydroxymethyldihydropteridine diphosphokinase [Victivallaceae bacterium]
MQPKLTEIVLAAGGNIGDSAAIFRFAAARLHRGGVKNIRMSALYRSSPENCPPGTPDFINAAMVGQWDGLPGELLKLCQETETAAGRPRVHGFNAPRTLDLDIILFGDEIIDLPGLRIPHPRAARRRFVLEPLAELIPGRSFPDRGQTVAQLLKALGP